MYRSSIENVQICLGIQKTCLDFDLRQIRFLTEARAQTSYQGKS